MTKDELAVNFWKNLKAEIKKQHRTYKWFCEEVGVNNKTLSSMIFRKQCPDISFLVDSCNVLRVDTLTLLYGESDSATSGFLISDEEKRLIQMLRSGSREEFDKAVSVFVSIMKDISADENYWRWDNKTKQFCHTEIAQNDVDSEPNSDLT